MKKKVVSGAITFPRFGPRGLLIKYVISTFEGFFKLSCSVIYITNSTNIAAPTSCDGRRTANNLFILDLNLNLKLKF